MKFLKFTLYLFVTLAFTTSLLYFWDNRPCNKPITYKLGKIDSGFNLSQKDILKNIDTASTIWEKAFSKNLFEYDPNGSLTINFTYDERQRAVEVRNTIDQKSIVAKTQKEEFDELTRQYELMKLDYENAVKDFNNSINTFTRNQYDLKKKVLDDQRIELNNLSNKINSNITKYNTLIGSINSNVKIANKTVGEIEEGFYTSKTNSIDIYEFESKGKLIRVLAHELGHSIGLDHNDNPESIMYKLNQGQKEALTEDDIKAITEVCSIKYNFQQNLKILHI